MLALAVESPAGRVSLARPVPHCQTASEPVVGWPLLEDAIPSGEPLPITDAAQDRLSLDAHLIRNPEASFLVRVRGDALRGAGLRDGDLVVMDRAVPPLAGSVVLLADAEGVALRQLDRDAAGKLTVASNGDDPLGGRGRSIQDFNIWGVARWVVHRLWPNRDWSAQPEPLSLGALSAPPTIAR